MGASITALCACHLAEQLKLTLARSNGELEETFKLFGLRHAFETYEGDHTNRVPERIEKKVLPFFPNNLSFEVTKK